MSSPSPLTSAQTMPPTSRIGRERRQHGVAQEPRVHVRAHQRHEDQAGDRQRHRQAGDELDVIGPAAPHPAEADRRQQEDRRHHLGDLEDQAHAAGAPECGRFAAVCPRSCRSAPKAFPALWTECQPAYIIARVADFSGLREMLRVSAKFALGEVVRHRVHPFRGVIFDVDPSLQQHQRMVGVDPRGKPPAQGPALLPPARRERDLLLRRLRLGAEPGARRLGRPGRPPRGGRDVRRASRGRPLRPRRPPALKPPATCRPAA